MKQKIMKNLKLLSLLFIAGAFVLSCDSLFTNIPLSDSSTSSNGKVHVTGKIAIRGAVPEQYVPQSNSSNSKTAMPTIPSSFGCTVIATPAEGDSLTFTSKNTNGDFDLELLPGTWNLTVNVYDSADANKKTILTGSSGSIVVSESGSLGEVTVNVSPVISGEELGTVNLKIKLPANTVKGYQISWGASSISSYSDSGINDIQFDLLDSGETGRKPGAYLVTFDFYSDSARTKKIISFKEYVNVFANLETNKWINISNATVDANGALEIPASSIADPNRTVYYVDQTNGDDNYCGSYYEPVKTIQIAADRIMTVNDGSTEYTIYLKGNYVEDRTYDSTDAISACLKIDNETSSKDLKILLNSYGSNSFNIDANETQWRGIYVRGSNTNSVKLTLNNVKVCNSRASAGGGIAIARNTTVTLATGSEVSGNVCTQQGAGVYLISDTSVLNINGGQIKNNSLTGSYTSKYGAGIYNYTGKVYLNSGIIGGDTTADGNTGAVCGAGIYNYDGEIYIQGGTIKNNSASYGGGAISSYTLDTQDSSNAKVYITDGIIENNKVTGAAGNGSGNALFINRGLLDIRGGTIKDNTAATDCGICVYPSPLTKEVTLIIEDDAQIDDSNYIELYNTSVTLRSNLSKSKVANLNLTYIVDNNTLPILGYQILKNYSTTDYVKDNYSKFTYEDSNYTIGQDGKLKSVTAVYIADIAIAEGKSLPNLTISVPSGITNFTLKSDEELRQLSLWVAASYNFEGCTFTLTDDITMSSTNFTPIGSSANPFSGSFDGAGKTISNLKVSQTDSNTGLFGYVSDGKIENLTVKGTVSGKDNVGGIAGYIEKTSSATMAEAGFITNCVSYVDVTSTMPNTDSSRAGGICGQAVGVYIKNCVNFGTVTANSRSSAGIAGTAKHNSLIEKCVNFGKITGTDPTLSVQAAGILGYSYDTSPSATKIVDCYNIGDVTGPNCGFIVANSDGSTGTNNYYTNTGTNNCTFGEKKTVAEINTAFATWPYLVTISGTTYKVPVVCEAPVVVPTVASLASAASRSLPDDTWTTPPSYTEITLSSDAELRQLSIWSKTNTLSGYTFTLTDNITLSSSEFVPIGQTKAFKGTFDGGGYTIDNLTITGTSNKVGLFGEATDCTIKNVIVKGTVSGAQYCGGIVGYLSNGVSGAPEVISNCVSYVNVTSTTSGSKSSYAGGICGASNGNIINCVNLGDITANNNYVGGIVGQTQTTTITIDSCVNFGNVTASNSTYVGGIVGAGSSNGSTIQNCYDVGAIDGKSCKGTITGGLLNNFTFDNNYYTYYSASIASTGSGTSDDGTGNAYRNYNKISNFEGISTTEPFKSWTETVNYNSKDYLVPVKCDSSSSTPIGNYAAGGSESYQVGDIVFSDGSYTHYTASLSLTADQKAAAVGVVFTVSYNLTTGANNEANGSVLMTGLKTTSDNASENTLVWIDTTKSSLISIDYDGSLSLYNGQLNTDAILQKDYPINSEKYPALNWATSYKPCASGSYSTGWYLPSIYELDALNTTYSNVNRSIDLVDNMLTGIMTNYDYWSSSQKNGVTTTLYAYSFNTVGDFSGNAWLPSKNSERRVLAVYVLKE